MSTCVMCGACKGLGTLAGAREAFKPRPGYIYADADFPQLELYTLAQCCVTRFGASALATALNQGLDPHLKVAALIVGTTYDDAKANKGTKEIKEARGAGKVANFGFPGGLGIDSLVEYAKKAYGVSLTRERAEELKEYWLTAWPEMEAYFARVRRLCGNAAKRATVETLFTKRTRGNASFCAACNNDFQALGADCAKNAAWLIARAQYVGTPSKRWSLIEGASAISPLFNSRMVAFIHDQFISEVPDNDNAHDAAYEMSDLMIEGANVYLPDVQIKRSKMEPLLTHIWSKHAEPTFNESGRLIAWAA